MTYEENHRKLVSTIIIGYTFVNLSTTGNEQYLYHGTMVEQWEQLNDEFRLIYIFIVGVLISECFENMHFFFDSLLKN